MHRTMKAPSGRAHARRRTSAAPAIVAAIVAAIAFLAFRGTLGHEFVTWDDDVYVYENPAFTHPSPRATAALVTSFYYYAYIPVTLLSHNLDVLLWGMKPGGHHVTNVVLHAANAAGVFLLGMVILRRFAAGRRQPAPPASHDTAALFGMGLAAVVFAVHPLRAESVSWVSDRKDLLCTFFALAAAMSYVAYAQRQGAAGAGRWLAGTFAFFALAVLSKASAVGLPIALLLLDWLAGRRGKAILVEKIPMFALSAAVAGVSLALSPHTTPSYAVSNLSPLETVLFPFYAVSFPLFKTLVPLHLSPLYPKATLAWMIAGLAAVIAIAGAGAIFAKKGRRSAIAAWGAYLVFLIPHLAGLASGAQPVADRYSYLSTVSLYVLLGAAITIAWERGRAAHRVALAACGAALVAMLLTATIPQAARWRSSTSLWEFVVASSPPARDYTDAYVNLGAAYAQAGRRAEAISVLDKAVAFDPTHPKVLYNLGVLSYFEGDRQKALDCFRRASAVERHPATAYFNRALVSEELGLHGEAFDSMVRAARFGSKDAQDALTSRGVPWETTPLVGETTTR